MPDRLSPPKFSGHAVTIRTGTVWLLRLVLIAGFVFPLIPAGPHITFGPPRTVQTLHPSLCAHTRLTDEVDEWKIQRTLQMVREMGAPTIVEYFPWPYVEHTPNTYEWSHPDRIMAHAENQGLRVIARLGLVPAWARPPTDEKVTTLTYLPYDHFADFAAFAAAFAQRYAGRIDAIIVWNEPNLSFEWGGRSPDPEAYTDLLRETYTAVKAAAPGVQIMAGALAPTLEPENSGSGMNELSYLARMYAAGAADYFDILAAHTYGFTAPASAAPDREMINFRRVELLREVMLAHGDADTPVTITESGWSDDPRWTYAVRPGQRIQYTLDALQLVESWPWAEQLCLWVFRQPDDRHNRRDAYFALVSSSFYAKPIYKALQAYARGWESPYLEPATP